MNAGGAIGLTEQRTFGRDTRLRETAAPPITNPVYVELVELGAIDPRGLRQISERTRDLPVPVYLDTTSRVILLERCETTRAYYENKQGDREAGRAVTRLANGKVLKNPTLDDDSRRFERFGRWIAGKRICDFGCGYGGFLKQAQFSAAATCGVELREVCREALSVEAPEIRVAGEIRDHDAPFDVVTLFHVLEHLPEQVATLRRIGAAMALGGRLVVEVPHARDFLIQSVDLPEFRAFTFWSEHLVLHTRRSLEAVLQAAGFTEIVVEGFQRYGYTNHLHWFLEHKPGGHEVFKAFEDPEMEAAYATFLKRHDATDTLIATATWAG